MVLADAVIEVGRERPVGVAHAVQEGPPAAAERLCQCSAGGWRPGAAGLWPVQSAQHASPGGAGALSTCNGPGMACRRRAGYEGDDESSLRGLLLLAGQSQGKY